MKSLLQRAGWLHLLMASVCTIVVLLGATPIGATASEPMLSILDTVGGEDDLRQVPGEEGRLLLHEPKFLDWSIDGRAYVVNAGDCTVVAFDEDWQPLFRFGRRGLGPGEFEAPEGLLVLPREVWVFGRQRIVKYDLAGHNVDTIQLDQGFQSPVKIGDEILAITTRGDRPVASLDSDGSILDLFGPLCRDRPFTRRLIECGDWEILPAPRGRCLILDSVRGVVRFLKADGATRREVDLDIGAPEITVKPTGGGEAVYFTRVVRSVCRIKSGYLVIHGRRAPDDPLYVQSYDHDFTKTHRRVLPNEAGVIAKVSPRNELCLLDPWGSVLHICEVPTNTSSREE